ncbi:copper homeostasis periplasmic binding protein CopC [Xanthomonas euvesicatoria pv. allii]|uniref:copper homeostasis periplasmic binding protein CopC n=1 Tax=Xanthomonas euvesicatoria TaxID=456327 RepID=UPI002405CB83|nr:copper homeostasis periplasmic binding protein CopC [Xanthomonas euvesicatoria]MCP3050694.1 copper homeostasis periplasmic binding protein CopC [Xanthomonas euvesicatoria pv. allii]
MSSLRTNLQGLLAGIALFASAATFAHPKLVSTTPDAQSTVAAPATIQLTFTESLLPVSGAELTMTDMPGMKMPPMKVSAGVATGKDGKSLVVSPAKTLSPGTYRVDWHVVSTDTHPIKGSFQFTVK